MTSTTRCSFCDMIIATAPPFCPARMLVPGERFPHEPNTAATRMTREIAKGANRRARFGRPRKRR